MVDEKAFIFLNTKHNDVDSGYFNGSDKGEVRRALRAASKNETVCLVMHHHPVKTNTPLIDKYILENDDEFWNLSAEQRCYKSKMHLICINI